MSYATRWSYLRARTEKGEKKKEKRVFFRGFERGGERKSLQSRSTASTKKRKKKKEKKLIADKTTVLSSCISRLGGGSPYHPQNATGEGKK